LPVPAVHVPNADWQPAPQYALVEPHHPEGEQQFPKVVPWQVWPAVPPQVPSVLVGLAPPELVVDVDLVVVVVDLVVVVVVALVVVVVLVEVEDVVLVDVDDVVLVDVDDVVLVDVDDVVLVDVVDVVLVVVDVVDDLVVVLVRLAVDETAEV